MTWATQVLRMPVSFRPSTGAGERSRTAKRERVKSGLRYLDWLLCADPDVGILDAWRIRGSIKPFLEQRLEGGEDEATIRAMVKEALEREWARAEPASAHPGRPA